LPTLITAFDCQNNETLTSIPCPAPLSPISNSTYNFISL